MQNGRIKGGQLSASSNWDVNHGPSNGRIHWRRRGSRTGAWSARHNSRYQWLQVDFIHAVRVVKFATQGRQDAAQWVTLYYLTYSQDGAHFAEFKKNSNRKVSISVVIQSVIGFVLQHIFKFKSLEVNLVKAFRKIREYLPALVKWDCNRFNLSASHDNKTLLSDNSTFYRI